MPAGGWRDFVDHQHDWPCAFSIDRQFQISSRIKRRQAFGGFIQYQEARVGHQRTADRQHLLSRRTACRPYWTRFGEPWNSA